MCNKIECDIYSVDVNLSDLDAVYTKYRNIGPSEFPGFGRDIYRVRKKYRDI